MPGRPQPSRRLLRRCAASAPAGVLVALLAGGLAWLPFAAGWLDSLRLPAYDHLVRCDALAGRSDTVSVVVVDETTLRALSQAGLGRFFGWPREIYGLALAAIAECGARAVAFDIIFDMPDAVDPGSDESFAEAVRALGIPVVFAAQFYDSETLPASLPPAAASRFRLTASKGKEALAGLQFPDSSLQPAFNSAAAPFPELLAVASAIGAVNLEQDGDGVTRALRPWYAHGDAAFPVLSLAVLRAAGMAGEMEVTGGAAAHRFLSISGLPPAPLDASGMLRMRQPGGVNRYDCIRFASLWAESIEARKQRRPLSPELASVLAGRIVLVGVTAAGLYDLKVTPVDEELPGVFLHAAAIECFMGGRWSAAVARWQWLAMTLAAAGAAGVCVRLLRRWWALAALPVALLVPYVAARALFAAGWYLDFAAPFAAAGIGALAAAIHRYLGEERRSARLRAAFGKYLEPEVIRELERFDFEDISPEVGRRRHMTVMFSDVRGFTGISEKMAPEEVVTVLNEYLDVMTQVIRRRHGGTHDKFVGDAIMAFWGAPHPRPDHAVKAVEAAVDMVRELAAMQQQAAAGRPAFRLGVGINTGEMVVGNVGSRDKLNYTVIGDEVNLAARLEALTRQYDCDIIVGESTARAVEHGFVLEALGEVAVKGRQQPVRVFAVRGRR